MKGSACHSVWKLAAAALVCIGLSACSEGGPAKKKCYPVKGQLLVKSQPAAGARVILHPQGGGNPDEWFAGYPRGEVGADGSFEVGTYGDKDGAPAGDYVVLVTWPAATDPANEEAPTVDKLGGKYAEPTTSQFKAKVEAGPTTLPPIKIP